MLVLRTSEVLSDFKIMIGDRPVYSGRAVTSSLINVGAVLICEVTLEDSWVDPAALLSAHRESPIGAGFDEFFLQWQKVYTVRPGFKVFVAPLTTFLPT